MKITSKNLKTVRKKLVTMACKIAHLRDGKCCRFRCGRNSLKYDAHHLKPRSRGWRYGANPYNIVVLCSACHMRLHEDPIWAVEQLEKHCPDLTNYWRYKVYEPTRLTVTVAKEWAEALEKELAKYGDQT